MLSLNVILKKNIMLTNKFYEKKKKSLQTDVTSIAKEKHFFSKPSAKCWCVMG